MTEIICLRGRKFAGAIIARYNQIGTYELL